MADLTLDARQAWALARGFDLKAPHWDDLTPAMRAAVRSVVENVVALSRQQGRGDATEGPAGSFGYCDGCYHPLDRCSHCDASLPSGRGDVSAEACWLIERSQPERQNPPCWWDGEDRCGDWVFDANKAKRFTSKVEAESAFCPTCQESNRGHAAEHVFLSALDGQRREPRHFTVYLAQESKAALTLTPEGKLEIDLPFLLAFAKEYDPTTPSSGADKK